ncbi:MAG TPA: tetratricopeptide repeat protein, partial [Thermoanaerobaculia bacterium]
RDSGVQQFAERNSRALLFRFDLIADIGGAALAKQSLQSGITHLETMLGYCSYLPSQPLLHSLFTLGNLYRQAGDTEKAIAAWEQLCAAAPVDYVDSSGAEATLRRHAQENIATLRSESSPPTKGANKGCMILLPIILVGIIGFVLSNIR